MIHREMFTKEEMRDWLLSLPPSRHNSIINEGELLPYKGVWFQVERLEDDGVILYPKDWIDQQRLQAYFDENRILLEGQCFGFKGYYWEVLHVFPTHVKIQPFMRLEEQTVTKRKKRGRRR